jgi:hypothetical protein
MTDNSVVRIDHGQWLSGPCIDPIPPGAQDLLAVIYRALEASPQAHATIVTGTLRVLLRGGAPADSDCRLLASVLADATNVESAL